MDMSLNSLPRRKVFVSYFHGNQQIKGDQWYKDEICRWAKVNDIFIDRSVKLGDINEGLASQTIRQIIRDNFLRDSTVTILLAGPNTAGRKHVDWEIYSSMIDGALNKRSGILVINLPETNSSYRAEFGAAEKQLLYPETTNWYSTKSRNEVENLHPHLPTRIIDNINCPTARISVTPWNIITRNPLYLRQMIEWAYQSRFDNKYDFSRNMKRNNSPMNMLRFSTG